MLSITNKNSFLIDEDVDITQQYLKNGFYIAPAADKIALSWIKSSFLKIIKDELNIKTDSNEEQLFDLIHKKVPILKLNSFRLSIMKKMNELPDFRKNYFKVAAPYLNILVGNELAMQVRVNLSIQYPNDNSSLLPLHADTWSGDSPFEVVVWIPLVNCYNTKSMFLLPPSENMKLNENFKQMAGSKMEDLYESVKNKVDWVKIDYGNILIFNHSLPHGNRINEENETRWSINCRFKSIFTPYWDKPLGSFFEPITLRAASISGMNYKLPELK